MKNNKGLGWLIVILIVLVIGLVGYVVYDKVFKVDKIIPESNNTSTTTTITTTTTTTKYIEYEKEQLKQFSINELKEIGFKNIDIIQEELESYALTKLSSDIEKFVEEVHSFGYADYLVENFKIDNKTLTYTFKNNKTNFLYEKVIEKVKEIKYDFATDNANHRNIFVITEDNEVWYMISDRYHGTSEPIQGEQTIKFKKTNGKYLDVLKVGTAEVPDGYVLKNENDSYFMLENELEYDQNTSLYESNTIVMNTNEIYYNNKKLDIIYKFGLYYDYSSTPTYFISQDNYLYEITNPNKKINNSKVKELFYRVSEVVIIFEDGTREVIKGIYI